MITIFLVILVILLNLFIIKYIRDLEKKDCLCSQNWKKDYIKYYAITSLVVVTIYYVVPLSLNLISMGKNLVKLLKSKQMLLLLEIYLIFGLFNIYLLLKFTKEQKKSECGCEDVFERKFLFYYSLGVLTIYIIAFIISMDLYITSK